MPTASRERAVVADAARSLLATRPWRRCGQYCIIWLGPVPGDQRRDDTGSPTFDSAPLGADTMAMERGSYCSSKFSVDRPVAHVAVRLNAIWPDGAVSRSELRGVQPSHRNGHEKPEALEPGKTYTARIQLDDVATRVPKAPPKRVDVHGVLATDLPTPEPVTLTVHTAATHIDVPVRRRAAASGVPVFAAGGPRRSWRRYPLRSNERTVTIDQATGEQTVRTSTTSAAAVSSSTA